MTSCVPQERVATSDYIIDRAINYQPNAWENLLAAPLYVHWPSIVAKLKNHVIKDSQAARRIMRAWEEDKLIPIPHGDDGDELPSIVRLDERFPDNVYVFCQTFGEYVYLRKNFGREDIGGFTLNDV